MKKYMMNIILEFIRLIVIRNNISDLDMIVLLTSRTNEYKNMIIDIKNDIKYEEIIFNAQFDEKIVFNDQKLSGLTMAHTINPKKDMFLDNKIIIDGKL